MTVKFNVIQGDITKINSDVIVNAANKSLLGGGGVDGAIHAAAGPELLEECRTLNGCEFTEVKSTKAYNITTAKEIYHTVGPIYGTVSDETAQTMLKATYLNLFIKFFKESNYSSISIPNISTGIYRYPTKTALNNVLETIESIPQLADPTKDYTINFICFDDENYELYKQALDENLFEAHYKLGQEGN